VRGVLTHLRATVSETEVPGFGLISGARRPQPYLFTPAQLEALLQAAARLGPRGSLRPHTYQTLIGLLASTGRRIGEAIRLTIGDVQLNLDPPRLQIRHTKFNKSRLVPIHPTTAAALRHYAEQRRRLGYDGLSDAFFVSEQGAHLVSRIVWVAFRRLTRRLGLWPSDEGRRGPTLHSLRHSFAVNRLVSWYRAKLDVKALAPHLSIYLGHVHPQESYWYFTATPELLSAAADRFEGYANGRAQ
jgi:integrase